MCLQRNLFLESLTKNKVYIDFTQQIGEIVKAYIKANKHKTINFMITAA